MALWNIETNSINIIMSKIADLLKLKDYVTLTGTSLGIIAVSLVTIGGRAFVSLGFFLLAFTFLTDLLDGYLARHTGTINEMGKQLDSLNDSLTFGIAPAVLIFKSFSTGLLNIYDYMLLVSCIIFALGGVLRLARFNISQDKEYTGVPTPLSALVILTFFYANYFFAVATYDAGLGDAFPLFSQIAIVIIMIFLGWSNITVHLKMGKKDKDKNIYITFIVFAPLCPIFAIIGILNPIALISIIVSIIFFSFVFIIIGFILFKLVKTQLRKIAEEK